MTVKFGVLQQAHRIRLHAKFRLDRFILSPSGGEKLQILLFFGQRFVVSPVGGNLRKLTQVHNYKPSPIQRHQNRFCTPNFAFVAKSCAQTDVQKRDGQTNRKNRQKTFLGRRVKSKINL